MPRQARHAPGEVIYHVLNRSAGKRVLFRHDDDFAAFQRVLVETIDRIPMRVCGYCLMSNHWHLVLWPKQDGDLSRFMQRLTITHVRRWLEHRHQVGLGSLYQGRFKSFAVQDDDHFTTLMRYVQRNPLRAGMVKRAEQWPWSSLSKMKSEQAPAVPICRWPVEARKDWVGWVNQPQTAAEEQAVRHAMKHGRPFGSQRWTAVMEKRLGLGPLRPRGRPVKQ